MYTQYPLMYPSVLSSQHPNGALTTMHVPPIQTQKGGGVTQHCDQEDEEDYESEDSNQSRHFLHTTDEEMEMEEEEEVKGRELSKIMVDIAIKLYDLQELRKEYRDALPQIENHDEDEKNIFINVYTALKLQIMREQDGVPETVEDDEENEDEVEGEKDEEDEQVEEDDKVDEDDEVEEEVVEGDDESETVL